MDPQTYKRRCPRARALGPAQLPRPPARVHSLLSRSSRRFGRRRGRCFVRSLGCAVQSRRSVPRKHGQGRGCAGGLPARDCHGAPRRGDHRQAITYVANRTGEYRPSRAYLKVILRGARAHGLPDGYIRNAGADRDAMTRRRSTPRRSRPPAHSCRVSLASGSVPSPAQGGPHHRCR